MTRALLAVLVLAGTAGLNSSLAFGQADARGFVRVRPEQVRWVEDPSGFGIRRATIHGDPDKPGLYVIRIRFPRGVMSLPHFHKEDRHATVLEGTWYTGTGDTFLPDTMVGLTPGSYMLHPGGERHFDGARDEDVVLQIVGIGPSQTTRLSRDVYVQTLK